MKTLTLFFITILILSLSCARQTTPTGGPTDTIPPVLVQVTPPNKTTNFNSPYIDLTFDEFLILENPREQLLITPSIGKDFEATIRKKTVRLELNQTLEENTTYTVNFREMVQDITEKNPAQNLKYVFSTGSYLDSLTIQGKVFELLTGLPIENATVCLYPPADTFSIFEHMPPYATRTDKNGNYLFENLKAADYRIYAFDDKNNNLLVDSKSEKYGFRVTTINTTPGASPEVDIPIVALDARPLKIISARPTNTFFNIKLSKSVAEYTIRPSTDSDSSNIYHLLSSDKANIQVYLPDFTSDSIAMTLQARDSIGFSVDTTLYAKLGQRAATPEKFSFTVTKSPFMTDKNYRFTMDISFSKPVDFMNPDSIVYRLDSTQQFPITPEELLWQNTSTLIINKSIPPEAFPTAQSTPEQDDFRSANNPYKDLINTIEFKKGAFISIERDSSRNLAQEVEFYTPEKTATLLVTVQAPTDSIILQVIDRDQKVVKEIYGQKNQAFQYLKPGDYFIRLIIDTNGNRQWDPGNFFTGKEPEPVVLYHNEENESRVNLKANWEVGPLLITYP